MKQYIAQTYHKLEHSKRLTQVVILISFELSFAIVRFVANQHIFLLIATRYGLLHVHHLVPGIALLLISGYIGLSFWHQPTLRFFMAILFGVGAALTVDEFALWLFLQDVYWDERGRISVDGIVFISCLLLTAFLISEAHDHQWFKKLKHKIQN